MKEMSPTLLVDALLEIRILVLDYREWCVGICGRRKRVRWSKGKDVTSLLSSSSSFSIMDGRDAFANDIVGLKGTRISPQPLRYI